MTAMMKDKIFDNKKEIIEEANKKVMNKDKELLRIQLKRSNINI